MASNGRTRPDGSHFLRSSGMLTGVDFDNSDIKFIGTADIDIEAIAAAKPDLIITEPTRNTPVEQLEKIAPTVSIDHLDGGAPEIYRKLAQLTGTQARLKVLERRYQEQIKALKATIDTRKITVSVIQANQGKINAMHSYHSLGRVLRDAGFTFPPLIESIPEGGRIDVSAERLPELDGFVVDRLDWASRLDYGHDDGLTMLGARAVENMAGLLAGGNELLNIVGSDGVIEGVCGGHGADENQHNQAHPLLSVVGAVEEADTRAGEHQQRPDPYRRRLVAGG